MNLNDYQTKAHVTSLNTTIGDSSTIYTAIGMVDETGEGVGKIKKLYRDLSGQITNEWRESITLEIGDVMWYMAEMCSCNNWPLNSFETPSCNTRFLPFEGVPIFVKEKNIQPVYFASRMAKSAASVLSSSIIGNHHDVIYHSIELLKYLTKLCESLNIDRNIVMEKNIEKILSRKNRGTQKGSGDNR